MTAPYFRHSADPLVLKTSMNCSACSSKIEYYCDACGWTFVAKEEAITHYIKTKHAFIPVPLPQMEWHQFTGLVGWAGEAASHLKDLINSPRRAELGKTEVNRLQHIAEELSSFVEDVRRTHKRHP